MRSLIYLNRKNCDLFIDAGGMQKIIDFNLESSYPMKIRKVAGQVGLNKIWLSFYVFQGANRRVGVVKNALKVQKVRLEG